MAEKVVITVDGEPVEVEAGMTVAAALLQSGRAALRQSVTGEPRGPVCGMGVCGECRVSIDGRRHCQSCQRFCSDGMEVRTDA